jgi:flagellar motor switch/type III secretory pathway protein FliN
LHQNANQFSNLALSTLNTDIRSIYKERKIEFEDSLARIGSATGVLFLLRSLIGEAKQTSGINALLCQMEMYNSAIGFYSRFDASITSDEESELSLIETQFARHDANPESRSYSATAQLRLKLTNELALDLAQMKKELKKIKNEQLLELNIKTVIELDDETVDILTKLELI